jgi:CubicO group peptidase (beta-lactamase class C family)
MGNYQVRFRGRGRGQSHREPSPLPDGVENFEEIKIRHSKFASERFAQQAEPALAHFADASPRTFIDGIRTARELIVARKDEDRETFLRKRGFSKSDTAKVIETVLQEEGRPPESVADFVNGITAFARTKTHQDSRLDLEGKARGLFEQVH